MHSINFFTKRAHSIAKTAATAILVGMAFISAAYAETQNVVVEGSSDVCFATREISLNLARTTALNNAHSECFALGKGWSYKGIYIRGLEQCFACGKDNGFKCNVTQAVYTCENMEKEKADKAAKEKAEKEKVEKERKAKEDQATRENANRKPENSTKPEPERNAIDDAFSSLEKQTGRSTTAKKSEGIDDAFADVEMYRAKKTLITQRLNIERTKYHTSAVNACRSEVQRIESCFERAGCNNVEAEALAMKCKAIPERPRGWTACMNTWSGCLNCASNGTEMKLRRELCKKYSDGPANEWDREWKELAAQCKKQGDRQQAIQSCREQATTQCNPKGLANENACVNDRMSSSAPSEQDVRAILQKEQPSMNFLKD